MITVALIDDHLIVRSGFAQLLGLEPDLQVVAEFGSGREALAGLPGRGVQVCICDMKVYPMVPPGAANTEMVGE
ncbi:hypothetical protein OZK63_39355 [Streptomyces sp. UMAF16]|nr:hypothetical protein [Streptomyces sp. UMAF16]